MSIVALVSGGLDSTLMCVLAKECGCQLHPLFVNYGQLAVEREDCACRAAMAEHGLPAPVVMDMSGFGENVPSGLTSGERDVFIDAFVPGRNLLLLLAGAAQAYTVDAEAVAIGFLSEGSALFPDQRDGFVLCAEQLFEQMLGRRIAILTPLMGMEKADVVALAKRKGIDGTWSCHLAGNEPCGRCIACREFEGTEE